MQESGGVKKILIGAVLLLYASLFLSHPALAKKSKNKSPPVAAVISPITGRLNSLNPDDKRKFEALSDEQREKIKKGEIDKGFNAWMVKLALGEPFYGTEHHPKFVDYEEVWLYTRPQVNQDVSEKRIIDSQTNWPTLHRTTRKKTCNVSDFFVLWDRGVVQDIHKETHPQVHGSCVIETEKAYLPIVDGKPVEPK